MTLFCRNGRSDSLRVAGRLGGGECIAVTVEDILVALEILEQGATSIGIKVKRDVAVDAAARAAQAVLGSRSRAAADEALATPA